MEKTEQERLPESRKPYQKPKVNVYGRIAELTRGGAGTAPDGKNITMMG